MYLLCLMFTFNFAVCSTGSVKFHKIGHYSDNIREWGCPSNTNAETWETAHKWFVKRWIGRVQYNSTGMIAGLLRRNHVAESHRGSDLLETRVQNKRARQAYSVLNHLGANRYQKFNSDVTHTTFGVMWRLCSVWRFRRPSGSPVRSTNRTFD